MVDFELNGAPDPGELEGFFEGWLEPPTLTTKERLIEGSDLVVTARVGGRLAGFLTAVTDGSMHAMITLLEVRPEHRGRGIGTALLRTALDRLAPVMDVVVMTDPETLPFYERLGFSEAYALRIRCPGYQRPLGDGPT